jgi:hypothetical protein
MSPGPRAGAPLSGIPASVRARFPGVDEATLGAPEHRDYVVVRLLEDGDGDELAWLVRAAGRAALADVVARRGGRQLSRRSRVFWQRVLGVSASAGHPLAHELWPLA